MEDLLGIGEGVDLVINVGTGFVTASVVGSFSTDLCSGGVDSRLGTFPIRDRPVGILLSLAGVGMGVAAILDRSLGTLGALLGVAPTSTRLSLLLPT